jgi:DNA polymerase-3 subunit epsilon
MILFFDTETNGLWRRDLKSDHEEQPHLVSLAAQLCDDKEKVVSQISFRIQPSHIPFEIPKDASDIHGITTEEAENTGVPMKLALEVFSELLGRADTLVAHNTAFDLQIIERAFNLFHMKFKKPNNIFCTMMMAKDKMKLQGQYKDYKFPKLQECHEFFFNVGYHDWHDALTDVNVCRMIYFHMINLKIEKVSPRDIPNELLKRIEGDKYKNLVKFLNGIDKTKLNTWELDFCNSVIEKLNKSEEHILLSNKQHQVLVNIHKKHGQ